MSSVQQSLNTQTSKSFPSRKEIMAKKKTSTAVATAPKMEVGPVVDYGPMAGEGYENTSSDDFAIPFIGILQAQSPQLIDPNMKIVGAQPGTLLNTVTNEIMSGDDGFIFVPCVTEHVFTEWRPRDDGGGFAGRHSLASPVVAEAIQSGRRSEKGNKPLLENGNELVETYYVYGYMLDSMESNQDGDAVVLAINSSKIKVYKKYMSQLRQCRPLRGAPLFCNRIRVTTAFEKPGDFGYYNFAFAPANPVGKEISEQILSSSIEPTLNGATHPLLVAGKDLKDSVLGGISKAAFESAAPEVSGTTDEVF